uniref:Copia protein n=1 Tax=Tanacetum cinerariifolium TaxID=118510 RepID=A0A6L2LNA5_TANCI|nr:copia protein [Tanacetum cinerariifolium]
MQYGNFKAEGSENLEQTFNRLQAIVSHLEFMDVKIKQDDLNQKFLTSLATEWLMYTIVWRNRDDLDTMSLDDVYNHLKVYEPKVQKTSESNSQNMAFISSSDTSSGKGEVHTASVPTASTQVSTASTDIKYEDITQINENDIEEMDIKWNMALLSMRADRGLSQVEARLVEFKENEVKFYERIRVLERDVEIRDNKIEYLKNELEQVEKEKESLDNKLTGFRNASKDLDNLLGSQRSDKKKEGLGYSAVLPPPVQIYSPPKKDLSWTGLPEFVDDTVTDYRRPTPSIDASKCNKSKLQSSNFSVFEHGESTVKNQPRVPRVSTVTKKIPTVDSKFLTAKSTLTANLEDKGKAVKALACWILRPKQITSEQGLNSNGVLGNSQNNIDDKGYWDSGCSRYMIGNISYLSEYEPYDGGYVLFGHGGGKITGKGIIKTDFKLNDDTNVLLRTPIQHNMYSIDLNNIVPHKNLTFLVAKALVDESMLCHRRLGHLNFKTMNKLVRNNLVKGLPSKCFENDHTCVAYLKGKQHKAACKTKLVNSVSKPLHTLHMDLFGPTSVSSLNHKWVAERRNRTLIEATRTMSADAKLPVTFWAEAVNTVCYVQNRVIVNKSQNKTPYELFNSRIPAIGFLKPFGCHVMIFNTLDHLGKFDAKGDEGYFVGYSLSSKAFRVFNKRTKKVEENLHVDFLENKLIEKGAGPNWLFDIDTLTNLMNYVPVIVVGTSSTNISGTKDAASQVVKKDVSSLRYIALPKLFHEVHMETSNDTIKNSDAQDDSQKEQDCNANVLKAVGSLIPLLLQKFPQLIKWSLLSSCPRLISKGVFSQKEAPSLGNALTLSNRFEDTFGDTANVVTLNEVEANLSNMETSIPEEPKKIFDALKDPSWVKAMQEELLQFKIYNVWVLVDCPKGVRPIGTKWVLKNKKDEKGIVIRNKARLLAQGYTQEEGIDYEEVFAPVARIGAIRLFLAYASFIGFIVYQMDVKSAFLYDTINEEVYVMQPLGLQDLKFPKRVYKVEKAMYGLH